MLESKDLIWGVRALDAVERAIRNALEKGDAQDRAFREKIYRSAFAALERSLEKAGAGDEAARQRRQNLKSKITAIESEFIPAAPQPRPSPAEQPAPPTPRQPSPPPPPEPRPTEAPAQTAPAPPSGDLPRIEHDDAPGWQDQEDAEIDAQDMGRPRRSFALIFMAATVVAAFGIGVWWTLESGILMSSSERDTSVPNPPRVLEEEDFEPSGETASAPAAPLSATGSWITIFAPADPTTVSVSGGASAEVVREDDEAYLRLSASSPGAAAIFDVGQGILETLAGRRALFSIAAASDEGRETQLSISCNFGELGDCGRIRYVVGATRTDYLFEVNLPDRRPGAGGTIAVIADIEGRGRPVKIFEIRASTAD